MQYRYTKIMLIVLALTCFTPAAIAQDESVEINVAMSDAWYNPLTNGQGLFIIVWEGLNTVFAAWFTFDTERPPDDVTANLGEPGHRWLTAQGTYEGSVATLNLYQTEGGVFDAPQPPAVTDQEPIGTATIDWADCNSALMTYSIPELGFEDRGVLLTRVVNENVKLCEDLQPDG